MNIEEAEAAIADLRALVDEQAADLARHRVDLDRCRAWFRSIKRHWSRWDDVRTLSGEPSTTQQVDAWLAATSHATSPEGGSL